jgi:hypothetical protein
MSPQRKQGHLASAAGSKRLGLYCHGSPARIHTSIQIQEGTRRIEGRGPTQREVVNLVRPEGAAISNRLLCSGLTSLLNSGRCPFLVLAASFSFSREPLKSVFLSPRGFRRSVHRVRLNLLDRLCRPCCEAVHTASTFTAMNPMSRRISMLIGMISRPSSGWSRSSSQGTLGSRLKNCGNYKNW